MKKLFHSILFAALGMTATQVLAARIPEGTYIQTHVDTLSQCSNCRIDITKEAPHIIKITSSNNWVGYAYYDEESDTYFGMSEWRYDVGGYFEGIVSKLKLKYNNKTKTLISEFDNKKHDFTVTYVPHK